ncbi:uracil-DNA glycosylase [Candidatus Desulforudis audaxviator]|uniref:Type-4 uracil-DNA glycosylase n=1 Tax=Desulforudis audaxviator (strain MP104C) TaxID=477974 RepID=B1I4W5_DESAP|nr:uracil-DNA glycosylase [Candidatus Desulforudis audaxviator]ACA60033.1 phage SPO1 DNA polymerase-related protein [Candidatus Desulforudis audaxviator MP104C]AZK60064.1 uracil-DNA glycosylase [Candidatus Desulforudis audaxviator]
MNNLEQLLDRLCNYLPKPAVDAALEQLGGLSGRPSGARTPCPRRCPELSPCRPVPGQGSRRSRLVILGEAPGTDEDAIGHPFVGQSGLLLTAALNSLGVDRNRVFITNVVRCRPPNNREPHSAEQEACRQLLKDELTGLPSGVVVLTLGNVPLRFMRGTSGPGVTACRGVWLESFRWQRSLVAAVIPTYHPAFVLRRLDGDILDQFVRDIREAVGLALALRWPAFLSAYYHSGLSGS